MSFRFPRREFLVAAGGSMALGALGASPMRGEDKAVAKSPFKLSVITDEISQDLGHALEVASKEFGLGYVELRGVWKKNIVRLDDKELAEALRLLKQYNLRVTDIASPLFKVDWPGAPKFKNSPNGGQYGADFTFAQQDEVLERATHAAKTLGTDRIRCFDFWRLDDPQPYRAGIDERLRQGAEKAAKDQMILVLENEYECNTGTGTEAARTLAAVKNTNFFLNWDPGNAAALGEKAYPDGYNLIPKDRIGHMHCKDVKRKPDGTFDKFECMGRGVIDYVAQFKAMVNDGYHGTMSLETHWSGAGTAEESSRQSMAGMKKQLIEAGAL